MNILPLIFILLALGCTDPDPAPVVVEDSVVIELPATAADNAVEATAKPNKGKSKRPVKESKPFEDRP
jgi:hypothetical protein